MAARIIILEVMGTALLAWIISAVSSLYGTAGM